MNVRRYKMRNAWKKVKIRALHPPPLYRKQGGIEAKVFRNDGTVEDLGRIADWYTKRWETKAK